MDSVTRLIAADRETKKRICVVGCSMEDVWLHGDMLPSQDGVMKFVERRRLRTPGGAAGAARQLFHWGCDVALVSLLPYAVYSHESWSQFSCDYSLESRRMPTKTRYIDPSGRIVFRHDLDNGYGLDANGMRDAREQALKAVKGCPWDAVLISDYEKGFVDEAMIRAVIEHCRGKKIPVVADAKRPPAVYDGAFLKSNRDYRERFFGPSTGRFGRICTDGPHNPIVNEIIDMTPRAPVRLRNHVGAGDAFSAHLVLALAHGLSLEDAATIAHSAGRVYVQHEHGRPPWPHEIKRDHDPVGGKVVPAMLLPALRRSIPGRIVFSPGCFRLGVHAGHCFTLEWAKAQGDVLIVGLNADSSVRRIKPGKAVLPAAERAAMLAGLSAVDWIVPFEEDTPEAVIKVLQPDLMAKGSDNAGRLVPGHDLVECKTAPESPFPRHSSDL